MAKLLKLEVNVTVNPPEKAPNLRQGLWVHCVAAGQNGKSLGKAKTDASGHALVKLEIPTKNPPPMEVIVSPLSKLTEKKRVKTEKVLISKWSGGAEQFKADVSVKLSTLFWTSVNWLDEQFTVEGVLLNRYTDPETEATVETPIRHGKVKLFDVDRVKLRRPICLPDYFCLPRIIDCTPNCKPFICTPMIHCNPIPCVPNFCIPEVEPKICTPQNGPCGPWVERGIFDPGVVERKVEMRSMDSRIEMKSMETAKSPGCCGSETPVMNNAPRMLSLPLRKPLSSPALSGKAYAGGLGYSPSDLLTISSYKKNLLGEECETDDNGRFWFTFTRKDFFEAPAGTTHTEDVDWDEYPDLFFEARLWIDEQLRLIYQEPYSNTRWNAGTYSYVTLYVDGKLPQCDPADPVIDPEQPEDFLFHNVGIIEPGWIDGNGIIKHAPAPSAATYWTDWNEYVFGGRLEISGQFQMDHVGKYYQVEYQRNGESDWKPILGEQWYYSHYLGDAKWETLIKAPESFQDYPACYQIPDYTDINITRKTQLITWQSYRTDGNIPRYPNGLYHLRVQLLEKTGPNSVQPVPGFNPNNNLLHLRIDNNWPIAEINPILYSGELSGGVMNLSSVPECGFIQRGNRYLIINFQAEDLESHFRSYHISVNRGADPAIIIPATSLSAGLVANPSLPDFKISPSSYYFAAPAENFHNAYAAMSLATDPWLSSPGNDQPLKPCAYNFTLTVYDRVTNGYGLIHWSQHMMTLTVLA